MCIFLVRMLVYFSTLLERALGFQIRGGTRDVDLFFTAGVLDFYTRRFSCVESFRSTAA